MVFIRDHLPSIVLWLLMKFDILLQLIPYIHTSGVLAILEGFR